MNHREFVKRNQEYIEKMSQDAYLKKLTREWLINSAQYEYVYHFSWMGLPVIQTPQDIVAMQEIIWQVKPDLIIETGIARGGSLIFYASMLELLGQGGSVLGVDIDIREENWKAIEAHAMFKRVKTIEGSSTSSTVLNQVKELAKGKKNILVALDSDHTHKHVLNELELYSPIVTKGSYIVVFDTLVEDAIEDMPIGSTPDRPWGKGNNPKTAVWEFLEKNKRFKVDSDIENKLLITSAPGGYLRCIED